MNKRLSSQNAEPFKLIEADEFNKSQTWGLPKRTDNQTKKTVSFD